MSDFLDNLGIAEDDLNWQDLALCLGMDTNLFFDKYEVDISIARSVDEACLSCPVIKICHENGVSGDNYGVWGGVYLSSGSTDKIKNSHKTKDVWKRLKANDIH